MLGFLPHAADAATGEQRRACVAPGPGLNVVCAQKFDELSDKKKTLSEKVLKEQCKTAFEKFDKVSARSGPINRLPCRLSHRALTTVPPQDGSGSLDVKEFEGVVKALSLIHI